MTPSALLGSTAPTPPAPAATATRADEPASKGFDDLLQDGNSKRTPTSAGKPAAHSGAAAAGTGNPPSAPADHAADAGTDGAETTAAEAGATAPALADAGDQDDAATKDDNAPWPPTGLAGLVLSTTTPVVAQDIASQPDTGAPLPDTRVATGGLAAGAALQGGAVAAPQADAGALALPAEAAAEGEAEGTALPDALKAAMAAALEGADNVDGADFAPAPTLLHAPQPVGELRLAAAAAAIFNGEPTPTPSMHDGGFDDAMGARLGWLADQKIGHAHIRVSPDDMGTVDVRLQLDGDKVHASFSSPHVDVRQALEGSLPRLRELLGEQGFQLAHADVGQHGQDQADGNGNGGGAAGRGGDGEPSRQETTVSAAQLLRQRGLLDTYA